MRISKVFACGKDDNGNDDSGAAQAEAAAAAKLTKFLHPFAHVVGGCTVVVRWWIGVIIEHETGSVASANGVGTGSMIKTHAKTQPEKKTRKRDSTLEQQHSMAKVLFAFTLTLTLFGLLFLVLPFAYLKLLLASSPLVSATCSCRN